ncbi:ATP-binding response regulator [Sphingomonas bacterium]|uniref:ATP-binding response regulator n=1 Tax=Sphingomonas bacterium TaxID=1895847 RepID=UPI001575DCEE|nr:ATP-binding protein [Sphingomonas bacterium]
MLQLVAVAANDGIWGWDVPTGRSFYSPRWWELVGEQPGETEPHIDVFYAFLHPDDRDRVLHALEAFIAGGQQDYRVEFRLRHRDGGWRWILSRGAAVRDADGRAIRLAGTHTDITERVGAADRLERIVAERTADLVAMRDRAEVSAAATAKMLSATSHDIRQPLQAMALLLGSLQGETLTDPGGKALEAARRALIASMELLEDLLEYSRLDAGALRPALGPIDLRDLLTTVTEGYAVDARRRGIRIVVRPTALIAHSDAQLLGRIVRNLVSNSLKFTSSGAILVAARARGERVRIQVWDTGCGIAPEMQRQIFWEFVQSAPPAQVDGKSPGLGLGLAIVERLSRLLGHAVGMRSEPGRGSVFWIDVPRHRSGAALQGDAMPGRSDLPRLPQSCRVALIENDPDVCDALVGLLRAWGGQVVWSRSAAALLSRIAHEPPDLLIADWHIDGDIDGFEAFDQLERRFQRAIPGIVLTGSYDFDEIRRANPALRKVVHKPVLPDVLFAVLNAELARSGFPATR